MFYYNISASARPGVSVTQAVPTLAPYCIPGFGYYYAPPYYQHYPMTPLSQYPYANSAIFGTSSARAKTVTAADTKRIPGKTMMMKKVSRKPVQKAVSEPKKALPAPRTQEKLPPTQEKQTALPPALAALYARNTGSPY